MGFLMKQMEFAKRIFIGVSFALLSPVPSLFSAVITIGNSATHYNSDSGVSINTISNFTVATGRNCKLVLFVNYESGSTVRSITYGSQSFIAAVNNNSGRAAQIWYLDAPVTGTADVVVTFTGNTRSCIGVMSLQNAAAGGPVVSNSVAGNAHSINVTTTEVNTFVIGSYVENGSGPITASPFANNLYNGNSGSSFSDTGYQTEETAGLKTYTWTGTDAGAGGIAVAGFAPLKSRLSLIILTSGY